MPAIKTSLTVEKGISVFCYEKGKEGWYVRKWNKAERKYRIKRIDGASTQNEALANFYKALATFEETPQRVLRKVSDSETISELADEFIKFEIGRVDAGLKDAKSAETRRNNLRRMLEYLAVKGVEFPSQITAATWQDYPVFRKSEGK